MGELGYGDSGREYPGLAYLSILLPLKGDFFIETQPLLFAFLSKPIVEGRHDLTRKKW